MDIQFTVAIPTYNGAKTLQFVLEKLRSQTQIDFLSWEVIVVDNNSTDETAKIVEAFQQNWLPQTPLRYCNESIQGSAYARQRAIKEANGQFVGFLDDDNLPDSSWVAAAYQFGLAHPKAGAFGGQIRGKYEVEPPPEFERAKLFLVIREFSRQPKLYEPEHLRLPPGAGLVVRKQAWIESLPDRFTRAHRGGHDYEISLHLHKHGWEIWHNPEMKIEHLIPAWRMEKSYLTKIARIYGLCTCEIRMIITKPWQRPIVLIRNFLGSLKRLIWHLVKYRDRAFSNLGLACETAFFWGGLISPFYYLEKQANRWFHQLIRH